MNFDTCYVDIVDTSEMTLHLLRRAHPEKVKKSLLKSEHQTHKEHLQTMQNLNLHKKHRV